MHGNNFSWIIINFPLTTRTTSTWMKFPLWLNVSEWKQSCKLQQPCSRADNSWKNIAAHYKIAKRHSSCRANHKKKKTSVNEAVTLNARAYFFIFFSSLFCDWCHQPTRDSIAFSNGKVLFNVVIMFVLIQTDLFHYKRMWRTWRNV